MKKKHTDVEKALASFTMKIITCRSYAERVKLIKAWAKKFRLRAT
jgi:hypothetical protein